MSVWDVIIVGAGPAGASCAAVCARDGKKTLLIERAKFPREKVCGDCINPGCWRLFRDLDLESRVQSLPHAVLDHVEFSAGKSSPVVIPLPGSLEDREIAVKRSHLDALLLQRAIEYGADVQMGEAVTRIAYIEQTRTWQIFRGTELFEARHLVAADGRNSTVCRLLGLLPRARQDRIGVQLHFPLPSRLRRRVSMHFHELGYCGVADVGDEIANLCLVALPAKMDALKIWAIGEFSLLPASEWRTVSPLSRSPISPQYGTLLLAGDAARVVEPFTGEGIYYALASGVLAGQHITKNALAQYPSAHRALYRGRLWVNDLARFACVHPGAARFILGIGRRCPALLALITTKVSGLKKS